MIKIIYERMEYWIKRVKLGVFLVNLCLSGNKNFATKSLSHKESQTHIPTLI